MSCFLAFFQHKPNGCESNLACLLRPPPRSLVERGPPAYILKALRRFEELVANSTEAARALCAEFGIHIPEEEQAVTLETGRRRRRKESEASFHLRQRPFAAPNTFMGSRPGYVFKLGEEGLGYYRADRMK